VINCEKCGKENQDHYKFCLGCGAELPRKEAPKPFSPQTPPHGVPAAVPQPAPAAPQPAAAAQPAPAAAPAPQPPPAAPTTPAAVPHPAAAQPSAEQTVDCPQCGQPNPKGNRFCAACGYNLGAFASQPAPRPAPAPAFAPAAGELMPVALTALRADGSEAGRYDLPDVQSVTVGRDTGSIFAGDSYLSPRHATLTRRGTDVFVKDEGSLNGVYLKLRPNEPWHLGYGDVFRIGQEIVRFEELKGQGPSADGVQRFGSPAKGYIGRISLVIGRDTTGNSFPIPEQGIHLGRERGDVLFSEDGYVSGLHCQITGAGNGGVYLTDVGSSNGTFARLTKEYQLEPGDILLMGQQLFRVDF
jgi:pSer/pThr/pTyr-binding forkhead associated (FHA) protein